MSENEFTTEVEDKVLAEPDAKAPEKSEQEIFNEELVKTLQEALRVDYLEKFDVFAKYKIAQREIAHLTIEVNKLRKINKLVSSNNKMLSAEVVDAKGRHKFELERVEELEKKIAELEDRFSPAEENYIEEESKPKPKPKRTRRKKEPEKTND